MKLSYGPPMTRPLALTMPAVTVLLSPKGLPIAMTQSPTCKASESPRGATGRSPLVSIFNTAKSVLGSRPSTLAGYSRLSERVTVISLAASTTWLLVKMTPSLRMIKPEPDPRRLKPPGGGVGGRKPGKGKGRSSPNGPGGKPNPGSLCAALSTETDLIYTTAGDA